LDPKTVVDGLRAASEVAKGVRGLTRELSPLVKKIPRDALIISKVVKNTLVGGLQ
jgi:hypothetical protein